MQSAAIISLAAFLSASCASIDMDSSKPPRPQCAATQSEAEAIRKAFFFGYPVYEMSRMRQRTLSLPGARPNSLLHRTRLSGPSDRSITMPNTDTLYSTAWLDLSGGPLRFSIPEMGTRYHSIQLMDPFSDVFAILRNETTKAREYLIVGPDWEGEAAAGATVIASPSRDVWLVGRTFVKGPGDLAAAKELQQAYTIEETGTLAAGTLAADTFSEAQIPKTPSAQEFLSVVNGALSRGRVRSIHQKRLGCFARAGIGPASDMAVQVPSPGIKKVWDTALGQLFIDTKEALENSGTLQNGWRYPASNIGQFGEDDLYRSAIALGGLAALPTQEAINPITTRDANGDTLNGAFRYRLPIPADVPVDGFWSLTLYKSDGAGRWFLHENPLDRYAIRSTNGDLVRQPDGTIILEISHQRPPHHLNWLPAPKGPFLLVFRAYRPQSAFARGHFLLSAVKRLSDY